MTYSESRVVEDAQVAAAWLPERFRTPGAQAALVACVSFQP